MEILHRALLKTIVSSPAAERESSLGSQTSQMAADILTKKHMFFPSLQVLAK